ncbi:MAG: hypothetical protein ACREAY_04740 [Nitrososphaera sp.]|uniref:hypothetical protein n=1 Tax=Nitrososphaera sp. TaxID=1971748 RepID=UPI003D6FC383
MADCNQTLRYFCSKCDSLLRESETADVDVGRITEACPRCGGSLAQTVEIRRSLPKIAPSLPQFQIARAGPVLTLDLRALDDFFLGFRAGDMLFITGPQENMLASRLCVRALLPAKRGGLESPVVFIDAGNNSDVYQCVNFARQYGLDIKKVLDGIIVSRAFTIHQLTELIARDLYKVVRQFRARLVVISGLLTMFQQDPMTDEKEAERLLGHILAAIRETLQDAVVIVTTRDLENHCEIAAKFGSRIETAGSVKVWKGDRSKTLNLKEKELRLAFGA